MGGKLKRGREIIEENNEVRKEELKDTRGFRDETPTLAISGGNGGHQDGEHDGEAVHGSERSELASGRTRGDIYRGTSGRSY